MEEYIYEYSFDPTVEPIPSTVLCELAPPRPILYRVRTYTDVSSFSSAFLITSGPSNNGGIGLSTYVDAADSIPRLLLTRVYGLHAGMSFTSTAVIWPQTGHRAYNLDRTTTFSPFALPDPPASSNVDPYLRLGSITNSYAYYGIVIPNQAAWSPNEYIGLAYTADPDDTTTNPVSLSSTFRYLPAPHSTPGTYHFKLVSIGLATTAYTQPPMSTYPAGYVWDYNFLVTPPTTFTAFTIVIEPPRAYVGRFFFLACVKGTTSPETWSITEQTNTPYTTTLSITTTATTPFSFICYAVNSPFAYTMRAQLRVLSEDTVSLADLEAKLSWVGESSRTYTTALVPLDAATNIPTMKTSQYETGSRITRYGSPGFGTQITVQISCGDGQPFAFNQLPGFRFTFSTNRPSFTLEECHLSTATDGDGNVYPVQTRNKFVAGATAGQYPADMSVHSVPPQTSLHRSLHQYPCRD